MPGMDMDKSDKERGKYYQFELELSTSNKDMQIIYICSMNC